MKRRNPVVPGMIERHQRAGPHDEDQDVAYRKGRRRSPKHKGTSEEVPLDN